MQYRRIALHFASLCYSLFPQRRPGTRAVMSKWMSRELFRRLCWIQPLARQGNWRMCLIATEHRLPFV